MHKLFFERALLPAGWSTDVTITIDGGFITTVERGSQPGPDAERVAGLALPGLANLHSHTFQRAMAGLTEHRGAAEDHFWTWREAMYRFVNRLTPEHVEAVAAMAFVEMIESGFTAVAEFHYLHHASNGDIYADPAELSQRIIQAAARTGIGLTLLPVFYAQGGFGGRVAETSQRRFICDLDLFARIHAGAMEAISVLSNAGMGIAPHSLRAVTSDDLQYLLEAHPSGPVHIHIAEQEREVEECLAVTGERPVDWLFNHAPVDRRWCLVHATHMTERETKRLARSGAVAGLCPITESNLGDGIFNGAAYSQEDGCYGVGSDSNVLISAFEELRTLEYAQRLRDRARNRMSDSSWSTGRTLFESAARGGARALGLPVGALAPGCRADLVVIDTDAVPVFGRGHDRLLDSLVFATTRPPIDRVYLGGALFVDGGRHLVRTQVERAFKTAMRELAAGSSDLG